MFPALGATAASFVPSADEVISRQPFVVPTELSSFHTLSPATHMSPQEASVCASPSMIGFLSALQKASSLL